MNIEITTIKREIDDIESESRFELPNLKEFIEIFKSAFLANPLLNRIKVNISTSDIKFKIKILVSGELFYVLTSKDTASIDFYDYLSNNQNPIIVRLHLGMYMGLSLKQLQTKFFPLGVPQRFDDDYIINKREAIIDNGFDESGLKRTLFHEFAHFIDALNPAFSYSNKKVDGLKKDSLLSVVQHPWNCYIDRRLQTKLSWDVPYSYTTPDMPDLTRGREILNNIWQSSEDYNFDELIEFAKQLKQAQKRPL